MIEPKFLHPRGPDLAGYIPTFLSASDSRSAKEQLHENYAHGGGWSPFKGFTFNPDDLSIKYPGDPSYPAVAVITLRDERVIIYPHAWVAIVQKDDSYEVARMD